jgi:hypothetical protein
LGGAGLARRANRRRLGGGGQGASLHERRASRGTTSGSAGGHRPRPYATPVALLPVLLSSLRVRRPYPRPTGTAFLWIERKDGVSPRWGPDASGPCGRLPSARRAAHSREGPLSGGRASGGIPVRPTRDGSTRASPAHRRPQAAFGAALKGPIRSTAASPAEKGMRTKRAAPPRPRRPRNLRGLL